MVLIATQDKNFEESVLKSQIPVLVDFWAPWCGPCKMAEPILEGLSERYAGKVHFVKMNVDEEQAVAQKFGVMSIPTTVLINEGKEVGRQTGFAGEKAFEDLIKKVIHN